MLATSDLHAMLAIPEPFGMVAGSTAVHVRPVGGVRSERVTVPAKPSIELTTIVDVERVTPSARTVLGKVAAMLKSGIEVDARAQG